VSCKVKIDNVNNFIRESATRQANTAERIDILNEEIGELNIESTDSRKAKDALNLQSKQAENDYRQISNELTQANQTYNDQNILYHQQQNKLNGIVQSLQFKKTQLTDTQQQYEQNTQTDRETVQKIDEAQYDLQTLETDVLQMYAQREEQQNQLNTLETAYYKVRGDADVLEKDVRTQQRLRDQCNELLRQIEQERNRLDLQFLSVKERLYSECNVEIDTLLEQEPNTDDPKNLQDRLDKLRKQLDNYGEINHLAIEAYKELDERNQFIQEQRNDLLEAKKSLMKTMKEIEGTATELFMDAFNKVRDNFIHVFRSLFTDEDQCDLILVNPDDPLDSPIDIIAKPKGKRPQSINQLSGGEKSLTALALVFSLYLLKPAPFCILDEVDAPLDDANVNKFTKIIREFSKESQFIIVTHNKNTMASVDIIYGVTMYEEGVSRVVPVDFRSLTEEK
jgi:chromosome segregation protein